MMRKESQKGQGLIEYLLIVAVVVIAIVAFATAFRDGATTATNAMSDGITSAIDGATGN
ncbi:hypothetical protein HY522_10035 [bacterium]|nr:hypothetical protein [bacterium]